MLGSRGGYSTYSAAAGGGGLKKIFSGVRFVLLGFDSVSEAQYQSELIRRGGTNVGKYDPICTHVIVSGRVYDDPLCVAARNDGKALVTELWVDDSVDLGALVDPTKILYRPGKDLNGIPGSELLCICLTGYQRPERDDIMKMVSLMGARFSKPLIANQVTHLICYKFEGEKYELAKRVNIKLVNHRWLEDCLKAWEILPIDNYTKSGWQLEAMEAEARDSEEETNDGLSASGHEADALGLQNGMIISKNSDFPTPSMEEENIQKVLEATKDLENDDFPINRVFSTPSKDGSSSKASVMCDVNDKVLEKFDHHETGGVAEAGNGYINTDGISGEVASITCEANIKKVGIPLSSTASTGTGFRESNTVNEKINNLKYTDKNSREFASLEEPSNNLIGSLQADLENSNYKPVFGVSPSVPRRVRGDLEPASIRNSDAHESIHHTESPGPTLPQKRKVFLPRRGSKSPKSGCQDSTVCAPKSPFVRSRSAQLETAPVDAVPQNKSDPSLTEFNKSSEGPAISNCTANKKSVHSKLKSTSYRKRDIHHGQSVHGTNISNHDELSDSSCNAEPRHSLNIFNSKGNNSSASKATTEDGKDLQSVPSDDEEGQNVSHTSIGETANFLGTLAIDSRSATKTSTEVKTSRTSICGSREFETITKSDSNDILMNDHPNSIAEESGRLKIPQQDEWELSSDSRDPDTRKLSSTASADTCKESNTRSTSGTHTKTVAKRNLSSRPKLSTARSWREKCVTLHTTAPSSGENEAEPPSKKSNSTRDNKAVEAFEKEDVVMVDNEKEPPKILYKSNVKDCAMDLDISNYHEKENNPNKSNDLAVKNNYHSHMAVDKLEKKVMQSNKNVGKGIRSEILTNKSSQVTCSEEACFILSGLRLQRKEFQTIIRRLRGRLCKDSHQWSYQATHFVVPDPVRRTEKFFAAAAAGRWILKTDYLRASNEAGKFVEEEPFEWYGSGLTEDGAISLEAPRKWRLIRERTGHGAFYGMRIIIYGECIAPTLDTLKRVVKAGDGTIVATSPPYTRFLKSGIDFAIVSPSMPRVDSWVQEFLRHEIPCVSADYLVEYVCKPGHSLDRHVLYKTHAWAEKSFSNLSIRAEEVVKETSAAQHESMDDLSCSVCGSQDRGDVMLICGDESGSVGCGVGIHIDCCNPPLEAVPEDDWFCPECSRSRDSKSPPRSTKIRSKKCN